MNAGDWIGLVLTMGIEALFLWLLFTLRASVFRIERILSEMNDRMDPPDDMEDREERS